MAALDPWTFLIATHALAAGSAIVLGGVQLVRRKGDLAHRVVGRTWATLMLVVAAGSFFFGTWTEPVDWFLRALAVWVLVTVSIAWQRARAGDTARHARLMTGNYIGLLIAFGFVFYPGRLMPTWFAARPALMGSLAVAVLLAAGAVAAATVTTARRRAA